MNAPLQALTVPPEVEGPDDADRLAVAGWLADFGAKLAGEPGHTGNAADWFLKPTTRAAVAALGTGSTP